MRSAYELSHVKSVSAMALTHRGGHAGNIVANWGDSDQGSTCTLTLSIWAGPLKGDKATGRAGGGGYDKWSAAFDDAARASHPEMDIPHLHGCGVNAVIDWLESIKYKCLSVIG